MTWLTAATTSSMIQIYTVTTAATTATTATSSTAYPNAEQLFVRHAAPVWHAPRPAIIRARTPEGVGLREAAVARARALLLGELDAQQRAEFERDGSFVVIGRRGRYRIRRAIAANVDLLGRRQRVTHRLCAHPADTEMPREDIMLAQLIHLRHDEESFLRIANRYAAAGIDRATDRHLAWAEERLAA